MANTISLQPMTTTGISGGFVVQTGGFVQGAFLDDPAIRYQLEGGVVNTSNSNPLWGGLPLKLFIPAIGTGATQLGSQVENADSLDDINAWSVFNQAAAGIITPGSPVPLYAGGMSVNFFRVGTNARIAVPIKTGDVDGLIGDQPNVELYWDPTNLYLTVTSADNYGPLLVQLEQLDTNSKTVSYDSDTGLATWNPTGSVAIIRV